MTEPLDSSGKVPPEHVPHGRPVYSRGPIIWLLTITSVVSTLAAVAALIVALTAQQETLHDQGRTLDRVREGRVFAVGVTCAVESAVASAGYETIVSGSLLPESPFTRFLERHGYPPHRARAVQARVAGERYTHSLSQHVVSQVGPRGAHLIRPDGSLDCARLAAQSNTRPLVK